MLEPVICFYKNDDYVFSQNYSLITSSANEDTTNFLNEIQKKYSQEFKIIQIDFEYQSKARVYVLHQYELKSKMSLASDIKEASILFKPDITKKEFTTKVNSIKHDISEGRFYQVNLTSSFSSVGKIKQAPLELFKYYFNLFKSKYSAYLPLENKTKILCYSPELFLEKERQSIKTQPIKGTSQATEDAALLLNNPKENAELSMIVDLLRNDLQSVCQNKVRVTQHRSTMNLNYVTHTYSEVSGDTEKHLPEILEKMLPAGSISGCPKAESLKAISEYENYKRGFYTGCIGWWQDNDFKLNLTIRSFLLADQKLVYYTGCGIVYDSDADNEWREFNNKAKHLPRLKVIDTFDLSNKSRLPLHIQRSFNAAKYINPKVEMQAIEKIYSEACQHNLVNKKCRIEFNALDWNDFKIEITDLDPLPDKLFFKISTQPTQPTGIGLQNFKTNDRDYWKTNTSNENEILGVNQNGFVTETSRFNLFIKIDNNLYTPSLESGCVNGCLRQHGLAHGLEIDGQIWPVKEKDFMPLEVLEFKEFYLGNSLRGLYRAHLVC